MIHGLRPRLAEGGKIKIGGLGDEKTSKAGNKYRVPVKYDHFVITKTERNDKGDLILDADLMAALMIDQITGERKGDRIREIPIVLHSDDLDEVFPTSYAWYKGRQLACRGDGKVAQRWGFDRHGNRSPDAQDITCPCNLLDDRQCKPHGTLNCSIVVPGQAVAGAVHKWRTTSFISIQQMIGSLLQIKQLCGTLLGVPLVLRLDDLKVTPQGESPKTVYVCHVVVYASDIMEVQERALRMAETRATLAASSPTDQEYRKLLSAPASDEETKEEQKRIAQEFHPPEQEEDEVPPEHDYGPPVWTDRDDSEES